MMTLWAIVILIFKAPFLLLAFLFKNRFLLVIGAIVVVAIIVIPRLNLNQSPTTNQSNIATYQQAHPEGMAIATSSRLFYALEYTDDGNVITMMKFYDYDGKKWVLQKLPLQLDRQFIGEIYIEDKR